VIGHVGSLLGEAGINIARFALGRANSMSKAAGAGSATNDATAPGTAIAIVQCDSRVPESVIKKLLSTKEILSAFALSHE
jgi:hypothetical protein